MPDALGRPDQTQNAEGTGSRECDQNVADDPVTGRKSASAQIGFEGGASPA